MNRQHRSRLWRGMALLVLLAMLVSACAPAAPSAPAAGEQPVADGALTRANTLVFAADKHAGFFFFFDRPDHA